MSSELIERLMVVCGLIADDLESELSERYAGRSIYPHMQRRYDRDIAQVVEAREIISALQASQGSETDG